MRISDWSSDVCSSDLRRRKSKKASQCRGCGRRHAECDTIQQGGHGLPDSPVMNGRTAEAIRPGFVQATASTRWPPDGLRTERLVTGVSTRSEEHTSELQ